jgi:hypothetical protein
MENEALAIQTTSLDTLGNCNVQLNTPLNLNNFEQYFLATKTLLNEPNIKANYALCRDLMKKQEDALAYMLTNGTDTEIEAVRMRARLTKDISDEIWTLFWFKTRYTNKRTAAYQALRLQYFKQKTTDRKPTRTNYRDKDRSGKMRNSNYRKRSNSNSSNSSRGSNFRSNRK